MSRLDKVMELIELANTSDSKLKKSDYKLRQKVYMARASLMRLRWNSSKLGTYYDFDKLKEKMNKNGKIWKWNFFSKFQRSYKKR